MLHTRLIDLLARKIKARRVYRQVVDELSLYSERELADIGLCSADIRRIGLESARQVEQVARLESRRRFAPAASHAR
jgi:uncharacterized protein YjiS (DUF1127 family)